MQHTQILMQITAIHDLYQQQKEHHRSRAQNQSSRGRGAISLYTLLYQVLNAAFGYIEAFLYKALLLYTTKF